MHSACPGHTIGPELATANLRRAEVVKEWRSYDRMMDSMGQPTLVWAHGLLSSVAHDEENAILDWESLAQVARVVRYDTRGHGRAGTPYEERAYGWSAMVDDMLWAFGDGPFVAGGVGMGAAVALYAALRAPRRVQGLVLALPPPAWERRHRAAEACRIAAEALDHEDPGVAVSMGVGVAQVKRMEFKVAAAILRGAAQSDLPDRAEVADLVMPVVVLGCDGSDHPLETARELADLLILGELHVGEAPGATQEWTAAVADLLASIPQWD